MASDPTIDSPPTVVSDGTIVSPAAGTPAAGTPAAGTPAAEITGIPYQPDAPNWQFVSRGADGVAFEGNDPRTGSPRLRVVLASDRLDPGRRAELARRCQLIRLADSPAMLPVVEQRLDAKPPVILLARPASQPIASLPHHVSEENRLRLAGQLVAMVRAAHGVGLVHGTLHPASVMASPQANRRWALRVDYTRLRYAPPVDSTTPSRGDTERLDDVEKDLAGMTETLRALLDPLLRPASRDDDRPGDNPPPRDHPLSGHHATSPLAGRQRALILRLLDPQHGSDSLEGWLQALAPWIPDTDSIGVDGRRLRTAPSEHSADQTGVAEIQTPDSLARVEETLAEAISVGQPHGDLLPIGSQLGRFRIGPLIGQGGMGAVYEGVDLADESPVAVKVLRSDIHDVAQAIRRFRKEARLLADVQNDYVVRLHHVGEDAGRHYLAMERVEGTNLKRWAADRKPLAESDSLRLVADIARGLVDAHQRGIVHRDIKPENVLLETIAGHGDTIDDVRGKLTDFGVARHVCQSASLEMTRAGSLIGTPRYMSPEQCKGSGEVIPASDVYALGVTLYELLTGRPPFESDDAMRLAAMHCFDPVPPIHELAPATSDAVARIVSRALAKDPVGRYEDASELLREIERVVRGEPAPFEAHPRMPVVDATRVWQKSKSWEMRSRPDQVWPFVSNTERLNRAVGLPSVTYRTEHDPDLGVRKFGSFRLGGVRISWEEHPFEWIEGQRMGILREFDSGPFRWFMSIVTLEPSGDGTRLTHEVRIEPRNRFGRLLAIIEADWKGFRKLDRVYRRIDRAVDGRLEPAEGSDAFEPPPSAPRTVTRRLQARLERIIADGVDPDVAGKLVDYVRDTPPQPLAQIRPRVLADELRVEESVMLDACLVAAAHGVLSIRWEILCPTCRVASSTVDLLSEVRAHSRCEACDAAFRSDIADAIELVFQPHPEIREIETGSYCIGGPEHSPHVVAQVRAEAGERIELDLALSPGDYLLRSPRLPRTQPFRVQPSAAPPQYETCLRLFGQNTHTPTLRGGRQRLTLTNDLDSLHVIRVERTIPREDCVTAAMASTLPRFRELFPGQTFGDGNAITAEQVTLVATAIVNADELGRTIGDAEAYRMIRHHHRVLGDVVRRAGGTVAKTAGEQMLAAFDRCEDAVAAALAMHPAIDSEPDLARLRLGVGVHRGQTLIATENERLDYFGSAVRVVTAIPAWADHGVALADSVFADAGVAHRFSDRLRGAVPHTADLPGLPDCQLHRLRTDDPDNLNTTPTR